MDTLGPVTKPERLKSLAGQAERETHGRNRFRWSSLFIAILIVALASAGFTACGSTSANSASANSKITFTVTDSAFQGFPSKVPSGWVELNATNKSQNPQEASLVKINKGHTYDEVMQLMGSDKAADYEKALQAVTFTGGIAGILPGGTDEASVNLSAGDYILVSQIGDKPITQRFTVTSSKSGLSEPSGSTTVKLSEFKFDMPASYKSGDTTFKVENVGGQPHMFLLLHLMPGKSLQDAVNFVMENGPPSGQPPVDWAGGMDALSPQQNGYVHVNLQAGTYAVICPMMDPHTGKPHAMLGMTKEITVQ